MQFVNKHEHVISYRHEYAINCKPKCDRFLIEKKILGKNNTEEKEREKTNIEEKCENSTKKKIKIPSTRE